MLGFGRRMRGMNRSDLEGSSLKFDSIFNVLDIPGISGLDLASECDSRDMPPRLGYLFTCPGEIVDALFEGPRHIDACEHHSLRCHRMAQKSGRRKGDKH